MRLCESVVCCVVLVACCVHLRLSCCLSRRVLCGGKLVSLLDTNAGLQYCPAFHKGPVTSAHSNHQFTCPSRRCASQQKDHSHMYNSQPEGPNHQQSQNHSDRDH